MTAVSNKNAVSCGVTPCKSVHRYDGFEEICVHLHLYHAHHQWNFFPLCNQEVPPPRLNLWWDVEPHYIQQSLAMPYPEANTFP